MRFVVLLFGFVGITLTAFVGVMFILFDTFLTVLADLHEGDILDIVSASPTGANHGDTGLFLILAAGYGFLGVLLSFFRCGWQGALLLLIPILCTSIMNPYSAMFTGPQVLTALMAFFVFPLPINASKKDAKNEEDDD